MTEHGTRPPGPPDGRPFVSVIVPVYNGEHMIGDCIDSLLAQDYPGDRYEVIVVDNGSTDRTAEIVRTHPVKYVLEDRVRGSYAARNAGARQAEGEALAFCDADQIATPRWLRCLLSHWGDPAYAGFCGPYPIAAASGALARRYWARRNQGFGDDRCFLGDDDCEVDWWGTGNICVGAEDFWAVGGFDPTIRSSEDRRFGLRLSRHKGVPWLYIGKALQYHRTRSSLMSILRREFRVGYGFEQVAGREGIVPGRTLRRAALVTAFFWVRIPALLVRELCRRGVGDAPLRLYAVFADALVASAELLGRAACRVGLPPRIAGGM